MNLNNELENAVAEDPGHVKCHRSLLLSLSKKADHRPPVHASLQDLGAADDEKTVEETEETERDQGEQTCLRKGWESFIRVLKHKGFENDFKL